MKAAFLVAVLGAAPFASAHIDIMAALHQGMPQHKKFDILSLLHGGHKKKPQNQDPTGIMSSIMAAANQGLAAAEKHHEVAVKSARCELDVLLTKEGAALVQAIQQYNNTLTQNLADVSKLRDTSKDVLEKARKAESGDSWDSKSGQAAATLNAQVSFMERELRKAERKHKASMRQAISDANLLLEGGVQKLSRKVGDISDMVKKTQNDMEANSTVTQVGSSAALVQQKTGAIMDCEKATAALKASTHKLDAAFTAGVKTMTASFDKVDNDLAAGAKAITDKLGAAQEEELQKVRAASASPVIKAPKTSLRTTKKHD